ncbi:MAG: DUF998 domain-containing protein [Candidatus Hodarchaeales archaeon]|jgi:hypothetical membrane protein
MFESRNYKKFSALCGIASPIVFTLMWILGGLLNPGYSHIAQDISELLAVGAPNKQILDLLNIFTSVLNIIFFSALHKLINKGEGSVLGPLFLLLSAIVGIFTAVFFPLDQGGEILTFTGQMHVATVMVMAIFSILGMIALWTRFRKIDHWEGFATYTMITLIGTIFLSLLSAVFIESEIMGLLERLSVYAILQFNLIMAIKVYRTV